MRLVGVVERIDGGRWRDGQRCEQGDDWESVGRTGLLPLDAMWISRAQLTGRTKLTHKKGMSAKSVDVGRV